MTSHEQHLDAGAYVLGALDDAEAARFEEHLAGCDRCAAELESLMAVEPLLAEFAAAVPAGSSAADLLAGPGPGMPERLVGVVRDGRRRGRRRRLALVAAAVVLIAAGPLAVAALSSSGRAPAPPVAATAGGSNAANGVRADMALSDKPWGTEVALTLYGVHGPRQCDLVAVSADGERQTVATWAVPFWGYGVKEHPAPLVVRGATGIGRTSIDHFEVRTLDGDELLRVNGRSRIAPRS